MKLSPQELLAAKRDGEQLDDLAVRALVNDIANGSLVDAQVGALAMAIRIHGMTKRETIALTLAMRDTGIVLRWDDMPGPVLDKHSTGGLGDKVSLALAPIVAACGGFVPMISGRGLGHTGGTLDKLESIPGFDTRLDAADLQMVVREVGCAIVGASQDLAPADRRLYAIRDVTATVDSLPLITASILAKKLAAGADALLMDVKVGNGAFLPSLEQAIDLAHSIEFVAQGAGLACKSILTDMNQCLGRTAGNALEIIEVIRLLTNQPGEARLLAAVRGLSAELLVLGGLAATLNDALALVDERLADGRALEVFARMTAAQGGPSDLVERYRDILPKAPVVLPVIAQRPGWVAEIDVRRLGEIIVALGGGRSRPEAGIDPCVGLSELVGVGERIEVGQPLCLVHARSHEQAAHVRLQVGMAIVIGEQPPHGLPRLWWGSSHAALSD
ncbi:thymidine phosphorylase [Arboricoccus pini]|uniref:Thymidine phosphorylase n=1 Tax=Arboricoccus pini TaxID=1963835 RepID=A0A212QTD5_9PROT|nr:thymidine phosphorylase [Arboricoccus pini]SNB62864.1 thymidine phosphorylase [Arboricoccus pini]